jgi:HopA1 effector protein family
MPPELKSILRAVRILSPESFSFGGRETSARPDTLVASVAECLYKQCYGVKWQGHLVEREARSDDSGDLVPVLQALETGHARHNNGWRVEEVLDTGEVVASKNGIARSFLPGQFLTHLGPGISPREGEQITVSWAAESIDLQPEFYWFFGETVSPWPENENLLRVYWNIDHPAGAPALTRCLTSELNRFQVPFQFKCVKDSAALHRLDTAVLYVNKNYITIVLRLVARVHSAVCQYLGQDVPLFTKRLAPGLAVAEDPGDGISFGMNRCRIVADALWAMHQEGLEGEDQRIERLALEFQNRGLNLDLPYLNPGSADRYELP